MPSVHDENHKCLEDEVSAFLTEQGFLVDSSTYHNNMNPMLVKRLQYLDTMQSFYVRGRADRIAVHKSLPVCFEWEAKTKPQSRGRGADAFVEALPVAHHLAKLHLGVKCLYVYRDFFPPGELSPLDVGIWSSDLFAMIENVRITSRGKETLGMESALRETFGEKCVNWTNGFGSNDPYCIIGRADLEQCSDWRVEVISELHPFVLDEVK